MAFLNYLPLRSKATHIPNFFTYLARVAKLSAECPAPCIQINIGPLLPATNTDVP